MTNVTFASVNTYGVGTTSVDLIGANKNATAWLFTNDVNTNIPTFNGHNFTYFNYVQNHSGSFVAAWFYPGPNTGTHNLVINQGGNVYVFAGTNLNLPYDTSSVLVPSATSTCLVTPTVNNGLILCGGGAASGSNNWTANSGQANLSNISTMTMGTQATSGAGVQVTTSWTQGALSLSPFSTFAISLNPTPADGSGALLASD